MTSPWVRLGRGIASSRLAAWLIGAQGALLLLSFLVPQRGIFPDDQVESFLAGLWAPAEWFARTLKLDHIFTSPLFYAVTLLLAANLIVCTWQRIGKRLHRSRPLGTGAVPPTARTFALADSAVGESVLTEFGAHGTEVSGTESRYYLRRGDAGFIGSIVLHAALVLTLVGGVLTGLTTFRGEMLLTEGQTRADIPDDYLSISDVPVLGTAFRDFRITLERMEFTYQGGTVVDAVATLRVIDDVETEVERARVNYPLKVKGKSFLLQEAGHSVWITVTDAEGAAVLDSFVNLATVTDLGYADSVPVPSGQIRVLSRPDASRPVTEPVTEGLHLRSPVIGLSIGEAPSPEDYVWVAPGSAPVTLGSYQVSVNEVRVWNRFLVRADDGRWAIYASFLLIIAGSLVRFLDPDRWLKVALFDSTTGVELHLWGAERYRSDVLPREGERIARALLHAGVTERVVAGVGGSGNTSPEEADDDC